MTTTTITVSTAAELLSALAASTGGETILLEGGDYGALSLSAKNKFDLDLEGVTIKSADPENPAVFSTMLLHSVSNLTIDGVVFDYTFAAGDLSYTKPFQVASSSGITIINSTFDGDVATGVSADDDGYGYAYGLVVRNSSGVTVENNDFHNWLRAAIFDTSSDLAVIGNEVYDIRSDGMDFVAVQNVLIEDNYFHDFRASYDSIDHRDMIQFWTNGTTTPSTDITINNNIFDIGEGSYTQSIFIRNEVVDNGLAGAEMFYQNITITNNTIYNSHLHGITVGQTDGLVISGNSIISVPDTNNPAADGSAVWIPTIRVLASALNVEISNNIVAKITGYTSQSDWSVTGNVLIQNTDANAAGYYGDVFVTSSMDASNGVHAYVAQPGGAIDTAGAGSTETAAVTELDVYALYNATRTSGGNVVFDASLTQTLLGSEGVGATYVWTFGDGTTLEGVTVNHSYAGGDKYGVTLTVTTADRVLTAGSTVVVPGPQVVSYDADTQSFVVHHAGTDTSLGKLTSLDGNEIQLGASGTVASIARGNLSTLRGSDDFSIDFSLQADTVGTLGELFRLHISFIASVNKTGNLVFQIFDASGSSKTLTSTGANLSDGAEHDVSVQLSDGVLQIYIDGTESGSLNFTGSLPTSGSWDLSFGNPWGKANFAGDLSAFSISVDNGEYGQSETQDLQSDDSQTATSDDSSSVDAGSVDGGAGTTEGATDGSDTSSDTDTAAGRGVATEETGATQTDSSSSATSSDGLTTEATDTAGNSVSESGSNAYSESDQIAFSVDFTRTGEGEGTEQLVWNHTNLDLSLDGDGLVVQVATADQGLKSYRVADLGLDDTETHNVTFMLDTVEDRLQILVDGEIALDVADADYDIAGGSEREWGWSLGSEWNSSFEGEISAFQLTDKFDLLEPNSPDGSTLVV